MNKQPPLIPAIITLIDQEITRLEPAMDDMDAGIIEGLRIGRAIASKAERDRWGDAFSEYKDTTGCF